MSKHRNTIDTFGGMKLTGLGPLKDMHKGCAAIITAAGPSLNEFTVQTEYRFNPLSIAVAGSLRKWREAYLTPWYWVVSDEPIVNEYIEYLQPTTVAIAFQQAVRPMEKNRQWLSRNRNVLYTAQTMNEAMDYGNPYQFYSRGTVLIAALLAAKWMGIVHAYVFGFDCYRTKNLYHFDGRKHPDRSEENVSKADEVAKGVYVTKKLRRMIDKSKKAADAGLFCGMDITVVGKGTQQTAFKRVISHDEFWDEWRNTCKLQPSTMRH